MAEMDNILKAEAEKKEAEEHRRRWRAEAVDAGFRAEAEAEEEKRRREREEHRRRVRVEFGMDTDPRGDGWPSSDEADPSIEGERMSPVVGQEAEAELNPSTGLYPEVEEEEQQMPAGSSSNRMSPVVEEEAEEEFDPWGDMNRRRRRCLGPVSRLRSIWPRRGIATERSL